MVKELPQGCSRRLLNNFKELRQGTGRPSGALSVWNVSFGHFSIQTAASHGMETLCLKSFSENTRTVEGGCWKMQKPKLLISFINTHPQGITPSPECIHFAQPSVCNFSVVTKRDHKFNRSSRKMSFRAVNYGMSLNTVSGFSFFQCQYVCSGVMMGRLWQYRWNTDSTMLGRDRQRVEPLKSAEPLETPFTSTQTRVVQRQQHNVLYTPHPLNKI